ncbi:MAG: hypothetical protein AMXMBFR66_16840 [Pseudomonadota bacterium]|nr:DUF615 domain-containing protein [Rubrivivax sp.]
MSRRAAPHRGLDLHDGDDDDGQAARPSKTGRKREAQAAQELGLELASLPPDRLAAIALPEALREAIDAYRRTKSHEGRRRQLQYVGKLMRSADEAALREALAAATLGSARATLALHEAERWRAELLADDAALVRWLQANPDSDGEQLRRLVQAARRDAAGVAAGVRQPPSLRALYRFIRPRIEAP